MNLFRHKKQTIPEAEDLNAKYLGEKKQPSKFKMLVSSGMMAVLIVGLAVGTWLVGQRTNLQQNAAVNNAQLRVKAALTSKTAGKFHVFITTANVPLVFASVEVTFDPKVIQLVSDPKTAAEFGRIIKITPFAQANLTGKSVLALAVNPKRPPITTAVDMGIFAFKVVTKENKSTIISVNTRSRETKLVTQNAEVFSINITPATLTVN